MYKASNLEIYIASRFNVSIQTLNLERESQFYCLNFFGIERFKPNFHGIRLQLNLLTFRTELNPLILERILRTDQSQTGLAPRLLPHRRRL